MEVVIHNMATVNLSAVSWGLGMDAGGTKTRWALCDQAGSLVVEGEIGGMSGLHLGTSAGVEKLQQTLQALKAAIADNTHGGDVMLYAGMTGLGDPALARAMLALMQVELPLAPGHIHLVNDMDIAYRAAFAPGQGYLVYAGTGSIAAYIDEVQTFHRAGGLGPALGDEGGGYWIAREALAKIWRDEDRQPDSWRASALARRLFESLGGADWATTRQFVYGSDRGVIGKLALQVAAAAHEDDAASALLLRAGAELACLANVMLHRHGPRPIVAGGRVFALSPLIEQGFRANVGDAANVKFVPDLMAHRTAARLAVAV
jgi:N-acetylglucosamine kinase-like BadF-type ATPase